MQEDKYFCPCILQVTKVRLLFKNIKNMDLRGKTVLITGGSSGLGLDAVRQFSELGAHVIACSRSEAKLNELKSLYPKADTIICDVADSNSVKNLMNEVDALGGIDILYNNAGTKENAVATGYGRVDIYNNALKEAQTNYLAVIRLIDLFVPRLEKRHQPAIINTSSVLAYQPAGGMPTYSASKAALHSYTVSLRMQLAADKSNIKVYELMPPLVDTPLTEGVDTKKMTPENVNKALIAALGTDKFEVRPGIAGIFYYLQRAFPKRALQILNKMR